MRCICIENTGKWIGYPAFDCRKLVYRQNKYKYSE
jgi:hypothetical protein